MARRCLRYGAALAGLLLAAGCSAASTGTSTGSLGSPAASPRQQVNREASGVAPSSAAPPPASYSPPPQASPSFTCQVLTHNADTAAVNQFIAANGWDDSSAAAPQLAVTVTADGGDVTVESVTVAGYTAGGTETGSTDIAAGQVITAGQSLTFTGDDPWYQAAAYDSYGNPTVYDPGAASCAVAGWS